MSSHDDNNQLKHLFSINPKDASDKIETVKQIYDRYDIKTASSKCIEDYTEKALKAINIINLTDDKKQFLNKFAEELMHRDV